MESNELDRKWSQDCGHGKIQYGKLHDDDLDVIAGKRLKVLGKLQEPYTVSLKKKQKMKWSHFRTGQEYLRDYF